MRRYISLKKEKIKSEIIVKEIKINVINVGNSNYISLTDLARYVNPEEPKIPILTWMRNKNVVAFLGLWEKLNNCDFKGNEFTTFENEAGNSGGYMHIAI